MAGLPAHVEEMVVVGMYDRGLLGFPEGGITLKSGRQSPYYYNARPALSFSTELEASGGMTVYRQREFRARLINGYAEMFDRVNRHADHIFGKAQAVTALAGAAAFSGGRSYLWERVEEPGKTYGHHQRLEGNFQPGETVLIADDVVTDGRSKAEGAQVLRAAGLEPVAITLQFDREEGGVQVLKRDFGFEVNAITALSKAADFLMANRRIGNQQIDALHAYHDELRADGITTTFSMG